LDLAVKDAPFSRPLKATDPERRDLSPNMSTETGSAAFGFLGSFVALMFGICKIAQPHHVSRLHKRIRKNSFHTRSSNSPILFSLWVFADAYQFTLV